MEHSAHDKIKTLRENLEKVVRGKKGVIDLAIATLLARGHLLIEDAPGVGKTTLAHALARSISCSFQRIQFTSDLLPSDVLGVTIYNQAKLSFEFKPGPIFANIVLADEINRATPKTQSALLEAMNDRQVSVEKETLPLPSPFMLLATQNPLEYSGTFPLPESQLDRFTMRIKIGYPDEAVEREIIQSPPDALLPENLSPVVSAGEVIRLQEQVDKVRVEEELVNYIIKIAAITRKRKSLRLGVSPRGTMCLYRAAQAMAMVEGRDYCIPDDIKRLAVPVFAHRVIPVEYGMEGDAGDTDVLMEEVLKGVRVPI
ncbi:MAG: MoxR family ATPase [Thermodesulfobacteriota bacterium]